jgi:hypothetical protein
LCCLWMIVEKGQFDVYKLRCRQNSMMLHVDFIRGNFYVPLLASLLPNEPFFPWVWWEDRLYQRR